jgi:hypothetical protein
LGNYGEGKIAQGLIGQSVIRLARQVEDERGDLEGHFFGFG